jgi:predicted SAM-dependent methyltransferase
MTTMLAAPRLLNIGCGARFHAEWVNVDVQPAHASVRRHDAGKALPFAAGEFDAVYHSHLLEHLPASAAPCFLRECRRVLRPGGILRIVVPDLEQIARLYLRELEAAWRGDPAAPARHRWLVMELFDQATRECPGGAMLSHLSQSQCRFAWERIGADAAHIRACLARRRRTTRPSRLYAWLCGSWRERVVRWLLGPEYEVLQTARFRRSGEIHQWMYDRVALSTLLTEAGFEGIRCATASDSDIPDWPHYALDTLADGRPAKPDSLYVEARKP